MSHGTVAPYSGRPARTLPWRPARSWRHNARESLPPAGVLLASTGKAFTAAAVTAARLAATQSGGRVRVLTIARVHGSSFGLQHPGLMPNKKEKDAAQALVAHAIKALQRFGVKADGEVVITRSPARSFIRAARAAGATHLVVDAPDPGRLANLGTGAAARYIRFRLPAITLTIVAAPSGP